MQLTQCSELNDKIPGIASNITFNENIQITEFLEEFLIVNVAVVPGIAYMKYSLENVLIRIFGIFMWIDGFRTLFSAFCWVHTLSSSFQFRLLQLKSNFMNLPKMI